jgi:hypothetical protein
MAFRCLSWSITTRAGALTDKNRPEACRHAGFTQLTQRDTLAERLDIVGEVADRTASAVSSS